MSRTFRRKNWEKQQTHTWGRQGNKTAGYYTVQDYVRDENGRWIFGLYEYRAPSKHEHGKRYWGIHGESSHANEWSPGKWYRHNRMRENRSINRQEIQKWIRNADYEPLTEANPRDCKWDWR